MENKKIDNSIVSNIFKTIMIAMIISNLVEAVGPVIDGAITGRFLGANQMAAYGLVKPFFSITGMLSGLLSTGAMTIASRSLGKGDMKKTQQIFSLTCFLGVSMSIVMAVLGMIFSEPFVRLLGANDELLVDSAQYFFGLCAGIPFIVMGNVLTVFLQLEGRYNNVTGSVIASSVVNIGGDLLNVLVFKGGMLGIGLATSASYFASFIFLLFSFTTSGTTLKLAFRDINWSITPSLLTKGFPKVTRRFCNVLRPWIINRLVIYIGGSVAMAALSVQNSSAELLELVGTCCGDSVGMMCGIFFGEENKEDIKRTLTVAFKYVLIWVIPVAALCFIFARYIAAFYLGNDLEGLDIATSGLRFYAIRLPILAYNEIYLSYFQSIGDVKRVHILSFLHRVGYVAVCAVVLGLLFGITGVWISFPLSELLLTITILIMAAKHEKKLPIGLKDMLFLPRDFGGGNVARLYREVRTVEEAIEASNDVKAFCIDNGIDEEKAYYVSLCVEELAVNDVTHGFYKKDQSTAIHIAILENKELSIRFRNNGKKYDLTRWFDKFNDEDKSSYMGLKIVHSIARDITYTNSFNVNNIVIKV